MKITVSACTVRIDGIQYGPQYQTDQTATQEASRLKERHYPQAELIINGVSDKPAKKTLVTA